jgi:predicted dienelactone hydrolase
MKTILTFLVVLHVGSVFGQFQVGHRTITFNDPTRTGGFGSGGGTGRQIQTEIYYPSSSAGDNVPVLSGEHPVIVFGHGFAMSWDAYANIWQRYAAMGYILAFPRTEGGLFPAPSHNDFGLDLKLVGEKMVDQGDVSSSPFFGKVKNSVVIMGHSMGGGATMIAASSNANIKGIVGMAPAETDPSAIAAAGNITVPALIFSGSSDGVTPPSEHHLPIYNAISSECKSFVSITGGAHCYFANSNFNCDFGEGTSSTGISITRTEQQSRTYSILDPWLDFVLMDNCSSYTAFQTALTSSPSAFSTQSTCPSNPTPAVIENGGVLSSSVVGVTYQWYLNGVEINGATQQNYTPVTNGNYSVQVFFANGCLSSASIAISSLGTENVDFSVLEVYPNPTKGVVFLGSDVHEFDDVEVFDLYGNRVLQVRGEDKIDLTEYRNGVYFIKYKGRMYRIIKN